MNEVYNVSWEEVERGVRSIAKYVQGLEKNDLVKFRGIWGPPRGGWPIAVMLSHLTGIKVVKDPRVRPLLIIDDIADTGKTLQSYSVMDEVYIATLYFHAQSSFVPNKWIYRKTDQWIVYPWELS